jgi:hypothetical protein
MVSIPALALGAYVTIFLAGVIALWVPPESFHAEE